jgi:hypothetical protein
VDALHGSNPTATATRSNADKVHYYQGTKDEASGPNPTPSARRISAARGPPLESAAGEDGTYSDANRARCDPGTGLAVSARFSRRRTVGLRQVGATAQRPRVSPATIMGPP